ncbi:hypothetical protein [Flavobacterium sp. 3HN19-14]|uniref:hypothetical protein n=1 Tax=Flavobacterium sp. 3HN19-14 TaxID=3448133 RepID=UPI003EE2B919
MSSPQQREVIIPAEQNQVIPETANENVIETSDTIIPQNIAPSINKDTVKSKDIAVVSQTPSGLTEENKSYILDKIAELQTTWPHLKCVEVSTLTGNEQSYKLGNAVLSLLKSEHLIPKEAVTEQTVYGKSVKGIRIVVSGNCIVVEINEV